MATLPRTALAALAVSGLLLGACGGDDSDDGKASSDTSTTVDAGAVCKLITLQELSEATGETVTKATAKDGDACEYSNADGTAAIRLAYHELTGDEKADTFIAAGQQTCDEGTLDADPGIEGADPAFTCLASGAPIVAGIHNGTVYLLQSVTAGQSVAPDQIVAGLARLLPKAYG